MADTVSTPIRFPIQVCYASPEETWVLDLAVSQGTSVIQALEQAGLATRFAEAVRKGHVGIYGRKVPPDQELRPDDRIEIYRPLTDLPQNIRRRHVEQMRALKGNRR